MPIPCPPGCLNSHAHNQAPTAGVLRRSHFLGAGRGHVLDVVLPGGEVVPCVRPLTGDPVWAVDLDAVLAGVGGAA